MRAAFTLVSIANIVIEACVNVVPVRASRELMNSGRRGLIAYLKKVTIYGTGSDSAPCWELSSSLRSFGFVVFFGPEFEVVWNLVPWYAGVQVLIFPRVGDRYLVPHARKYTVYLLCKCLFGCLIVADCLPADHQFRGHRRCCRLADWSICATSIHVHGREASAVPLAARQRSPRLRIAVRLERSGSRHTEFDRKICVFHRTGRILRRFDKETLGVTNSIIFEVGIKQSLEYFSVAIRCDHEHLGA